MSPRHHYCTYFDYRYLPRGLALYQSLRQHDPDFCLWALCFDDQSYQHLKILNDPDFKPISLEDFTREDEPLLAARKNRSFVEFYFTCTASLPLFIFKSDPAVHQVTYLDADLFFFHNPQPVFDEIGSSSIAIIPHQFPRYLRHLENRGVFNVGWLTFRRDEEGFACLSHWRDQCLEWCYDRLEGTRYGDQGYLNEWPERYHNLIILQQKGANLAPWNIGNSHLHMNKRDVWVDDDPLIFFHFQSLGRVSPGIYKLNFRKYHTRPSSLVRNKIYIPYVQTLEDIFSSQNITASDERVRSPNDMISFFSNQLGSSIISYTKNLIKTFRDILGGDYIFPKNYLNSDRWRK